MFYQVEDDSKKLEGKDIPHDKRPTGHNPVFDRNETLSEQLWPVVPFYI